MGAAASRSRLVAETRRRHGDVRQRVDDFRVVTARLTISRRGLPQLLALSGSSPHFILSSVDGSAAFHIDLAVSTVSNAEVALGGGDILVNWSLGTVRRGEVVVELTRMELRLMAALFDRVPGHATHSTLQRVLWPGLRAGSRDAETRLAVLVHSLRKRLARVGVADAVRTIRSSGYAFDAVRPFR